MNLIYSKTRTFFSVAALVTLTLIQFVKPVYANGYSRAVTELDAEICQHAKFHSIRTKGPPTLYWITHNDPQEHPTSAHPGSEQFDNYHTTPVVCNDESHDPSFIGRYTW